MKLYLDDLREPKTTGWLIARDVETALKLFKTGLVTEMSLDHDLGENALTGYDFLREVEELVVTQGYTLPMCNIHSANPVGVSRMNQVVRYLRETQ